MREQRGYNPDADPQERTEHIGNLFEGQNYQQAVQEYADTSRKWSREGRQDASLDITERIEVYREKVQGSQPEFLNAFDAGVADAHFYSGDSDNDNLEKAEEHYQRIRATKLAELHGDEYALTETERTQYSEVFNAADRLGDIAFVAGRYTEAGDKYAEAIELRVTFLDDPNEQGPLACATYGCAASAFMEGNVEDALRLSKESLEQLEDIEDGEVMLRDKILALQEAANRFSKLDDSQRERILEKLDEAIRQAGGSAGGVKHIDFSELFTEAEKEINDNEE